MARIDFNNVYAERIKQINLDIRIASNNKKWTQVAKLKAEKARLQEYLKEGQVNE